MSRKPPKIDDDRLDRLLNSASWPEIDEIQLSRLEAHWEHVISSDGMAPQPGARGNTGQRFIPWSLAAAATLLIGFGIWMSTGTKNSDSESDAIDRVANSNSSSPKVSPDFRNDQPVDLRVPDGDMVVVDSMADSVAEHQTRGLTPDDYLAILQQAQSRRMVKNRKQPAYRRVVESMATRIGQTPLATAAIQSLVKELDRAVVSMRGSRNINIRQWQRYSKQRRDWEDWAWKMAKARNSRDSFASTRFAIAVSTERSLGRLQSLLTVEGFENDAAVAIASLGNARQIDRAISRSTSARAQKRLLIAMLHQGGNQPALMFLKYMQDPKTRRQAIEIANSTDQLPSDVWMASIASRDQTRFDAALAVSHVCDRRIIDGLIQMATQPSTSRPAMMALINSSCTDAKTFVAYAERDQQLSGQLWMARKKLRQLGYERGQPNHMNDFQRTF